MDSRLVLCVSCVVVFVATAVSAVPTNGNKTLINIETCKNAGACCSFIPAIELNVQCPKNVGNNIVVGLVNVLLPTGKCDENTCAAGQQCGLIYLFNTQTRKYQGNPKEVCCSTGGDDNDDNENAFTNCGDQQCGVANGDTTTVCCSKNCGQNS